MVTGDLTPSDEELARRYVEAADRRDRDAAFHELVSRYERRVYGICYRYFGNHADAQDAAQDTFLALARKLHQFRHDSALSTWIYRVATNACNDLGRRYSRRPQTPVADVADAAAADAGSEVTVDDELAGLELAHEIQQALLQLDELSRTLILLCSVEGQSYTEVSQALDLPVGTIKSRVFRARAKLAELLGPTLDDGTAPPPGSRARSEPGSRDPDPTTRPRGPPSG